MRPTESLADASAVWDISVPARHATMPGVSMAGFRARTPDAVELQVVPYPAATLFFELGGEMIVDDESGRRKRGSVAVGLAPGGLHGRGRAIECLQVRLSPLVAYSVLGPGADTTGSVVSLEDLWGRRASRVETALRAAPSWDERFRVMCAALIERAADGPVVDAEVAAAWRGLVTSRGLARVESLAEETGWSRKRLWSRFRSQVGIGPKRAAELVRFDHAAHRLAAGHSAAIVAAEGGYADQSHLHREVMAFAGITPTAVAAAPWLAVDGRAWSS